MKYTLAVTQRCNMACDYCYILKNQSKMTIPTAEKIVDFMYSHTPPDEEVDIGFFGGEPLLEFNLIKDITAMIASHRDYDPENVVMSIVSNGTIYTDEIRDFLGENNVSLGISCDGPSFIQDKHRRFIDGSGSSHIVEENIRRALIDFPLLPVNAVYSPENILYLPRVVDYFVDLGVKNIYLNHNISGDWTEKETQLLLKVYGEIGERYIRYYREADPRYINLIDSKITVILRGGYQPQEKCRMGVGEIAFGASGSVYPCERLIGSDDGVSNCIGNINEGFSVSPGKMDYCNAAKNVECMSCKLSSFCMNWCGCTNFFSTNDVSFVGPFMCASEKALVKTAIDVIQALSEEEISFSEHLSGTPLLSIIGEIFNK